MILNAFIYFILFLVNTKNAKSFDIFYLLVARGKLCLEWCFVIARPSKKMYFVLPLGAFINDVMQEGEGGLWFFDSFYEDVSKTPILMLQRGRGVNFKSKLCDVI